VTRAPINLAAFVVALLVLGGAAGGLSTVQRLFSIQIQKKPIYPGSGLLLSSLPVETESWMRPPGRADALMDEETQVSLGTKNTISRPYVLKSTAQSSQPIVVELHAAYYTGMIDAVPHVPERCFVGGGMMRGESAQYFRLNLRNEFWRPDPDVPEHMKGRVFTTRTSSNRYTHLPLDPDAIRLRTTSFFAKEQQIFAGYFFIANGGTVPNAEEVRLLAFDLNSYYAYFVKVQVTSVMGIKSQEELARHAESLIGELLGDLMLCTPDWVEVEKGNYPSDNPRRAAAAAPAR
jgi:hypothetical protein